MEKQVKQKQSVDMRYLCEKNVLTFDEAVTYSGYKASYLYKLTNVLPFSQPSGNNKGKLFIKRSDLEAYLLSAKQTNPQELEDEAIRMSIRRKV